MATKQDRSIRIPLPTLGVFSRINKTHVLVTFLVLASFLLGMLTNKVILLEKELDKTKTAQAVPAAAQDAQAQPTEDLSPKKVSMDDDPILGDKNAKVTIIEFSDYECPFCKQYFDDTFGQLKKDYIDTGKVKLVFRDLPLSFHENAHKEAEAAECAREQGGDEMYFKYHDDLFTKTTSNGTGIALDQLSVMANDLGVDGAALQQCLDSDKYKEEVDKDLAEAAKVGATGTPSFFIGKSSDNGTIEGTPLIGAQPYSAFQAEIDKQLK